jgi:uncharacterized protein YndB with AHSA1/START domain
MTSSAADLELSIPRMLDAPPEQVFRAWTEPAQLMRWWGPHGMTTPWCEIDLRPGGAFRTLMRDRDGVTYTTEGVFVAVEPPRRLVLGAPLAVAGGGSAAATCTIAFEPHDGGTRLTATWRHASAAQRIAQERLGFTEGWGQMLDRLDAHLARRIGEAAARSVAA